ncbi:unnamed protein product [Protopolystoma xenopodis]|uniref:Uncharacterized protein n=1 Tax=Protopolystoma xenopodis TaxID=117903 RepID=A0A448WT34_9PLAT|nr:unnamed protein product [Protopolystoma xenopodis]
MAGPPGALPLFVAAGTAAASIGIPVSGRSNAVGAAGRTQGILNLLLGEAKSDALTEARFDLNSGKYLRGAADFDSPGNILWLIGKIFL